MVACRYAYYAAQQQASAVDPYTAAAQAAYLQQPAIGGAGSGGFPGGFVNINSPAGFALNGSTAGFGMAPLQLEQQMAQMQLMQRPQPQPGQGQGGSGLSSQETAGGNNGMSGGGGGGGGGLGAGAQSGPFDQLGSLGSFMSMPMNGSQMTSG